MEGGGGYQAVSAPSTAQFVAAGMGFSAPVLKSQHSRPSRRKWMQPGVVVVFVGCCCCDTVVNTWMGADIFVSNVVDFGLNPINAD